MNYRSLMMIPAPVTVRQPRYSTTINLTVVNDSCGQRGDLGQRGTTGRTWQRNDKGAKWLLFMRYRRRIAVASARIRPALNQYRPENARVLSFGIRRGTIPFFANVSVSSGMLDIRNTNCVHLHLQRDPAHPLPTRDLIVTYGDSNRTTRCMVKETPPSENG